MSTVNAKNTEKLHPRNRHRGRYDLKELLKVNPAIKKWVKTNPRGERTVDFSRTEAVLELNKALLKKYYGIQSWHIPDGNLCPPVPGRADYVHYLADLLMASGIKRKSFNRVHVLDVGTGANLIYPIIGMWEYDWSFTVSDIETEALGNVHSLIQENSQLSGIKVQLQKDRDKIFDGVVTQDAYFDLTMCNPPFHDSQLAAETNTRRKVQNLGDDSGATRTAVKSNFAGKSNELWCNGGELAFIRRMINESEAYSEQVGWFTCLVSKKENLGPLRKSLKRKKVEQIKTVTMRQGQKVSRFLAWGYRSNISKS